MTAVQPIAAGVDAASRSTNISSRNSSCASSPTITRARPRRQEKLYNKNKVVNVMDLGEDEPRFIVKAVKRMFGHFDMYCDTSALTSAQKRRVETELGKLETEISSILQRILPACNDGTNIVSLLRHEEFVLKKLTFVMKY